MYGLKHFDAWPVAYLEIWNEECHLQVGGAGAIRPSVWPPSFLANSHTAWHNALMRAYSILNDGLFIVVRNTDLIHPWRLFGPTDTIYCDGKRLALCRPSIYSCLCKVTLWLNDFVPAGSGMAVLPYSLLSVKYNAGNCECCVCV